MCMHSTVNSQLQQIKCVKYIVLDQQLNVIYVNNGNTLSMDKTLTIDRDVTLINLELY